MSGSAPARAYAKPDPANPKAATTESAVSSASRYIVPGPEVAATSIARGRAKSFQLSDFKAPTYILVALLATFIVIAPYLMHANWNALGPVWARIASAIVPGSRA